MNNANINSENKKEDSGVSELFSDYASFYDILYQDKDYTKESIYVSQLIEKFNSKPKDKLNIIDLACGTGKHAIELFKMGFNIDGSDISKEMISVAQKECCVKNIDIKFFNESFQTSGNIKKKYDVILSMFSSINYLTEYNDFSSALKNISYLLTDDGIFIFDFWNGDAVVDLYSPIKVKRMKKDNREILRISETSIDRVSQIAKVDFNFIMMESGRILKDFKEIHSIRYYFLQEMNDLLCGNGFNVIFRCPFMKITDNISSSEWNITYVAKKKRG